MAQPCRFDDSLPRLVSILAKQLGRAQASAGVILRDATGRLCYLTEDSFEVEVLQAVSDAAFASLGAYARTDGVIRAGRKIAPEILADIVALALDLDDATNCELTVRYVDRRIVGTDWLQRPTPLRENSPARVPRPVRVVFSSMKGGVGRSTALTVVAAEEARKGRNVLVVDLDLEAPGVGSLLLDEERMPAFGVIDYLVERNLGPVAGDLLRDLVGTSALTQGHGLVNVVPAVGARTLRSPTNYLAKLSRAMLETIEADSPTSLALKLRELVSALEDQRQYDLVLLDARAGLAEIAAGPMLALGAEVLIFGTAQRQTLQDLSFLFAHLASLVPEAGPSPWNRLKMVHAKAAQAAEIDRFRGELWEIFSEYLYVETIGLEEFNFDVASPEAPHFPILIPLDLAFVD
ncbi:MAG TPA: AAA family ATPase [Kofleriaceae bacterium]|nr:AAA family ATPase [Kofleriaceae bacterium]